MIIWSNRSWIDACRRSVKTMS